MRIRSFLLGTPRWIRRTAFGLAALVALYALAGFLVLPAVVRAQLPPRLGRLLGREVSLRRVATNPFTLAATLEGFQVKDRDGQPFLGWERLYVNVALSSLFTRTLRLQAVDLAGPHGRLVVERDGKLNLSDILERLEQASPAAPREAAPREAPSREVAIDRLAVHGARLQLLDRSPSEPFATTLGPLSLYLTGFRTERDRRNPYAFSGRTESGETFTWNGVFSLNPLQSSGTVALEHLVLAKYHPYYKDQVAFDLREGLASAKGAYTFQWSAGTHVLKLREGSLDVAGLKLAEPGTGRIPVELPALELRGLEADLVSRRAEIASLVARQGRLEATRTPDGTLDLLRLLTPKPSPGPSEPFALKVRELGLEGFRVALRDEVPSRPVAAVAEDLSITLKDLSLDPASSTKLTASLRLEGRTQVRAEGTVFPFKPSLDLALKVDALDLAPLDTYLEPDLDLRVNQGRLWCSGRLRAGPLDRIRFQGDARLEGFEAMDGAQQEPFLRYKELRLSGLDLSTLPMAVSLRNVELVEAEHRMVVARDGSTNVARALKLEPAPAPATLGTLVPPTPPSQPFALAIARLGMRGGRLVFADRSVEPNATLIITDLEGSNTGLSTDADARSVLDLKGKVGGLAPLSIQGRSMPLRRDQDTDVTVRIQGAELSDFTPYTGKYLGYTVRKGKLDLDARVKIERRKLGAQVNAKLDQFYLGDKVQSPDATKLPVRLGLALLRDRKGVIALELPVDGSLDDPEFHYGRIVWKAVLNVLGKIALSPFTLLGNLFGGGGEDLSFVAFAPGSAEPDAAARKKAEVLARSLKERPDLSLEVEGVADPAQDGLALRREVLEERIHRATLKALKGSAPDAPPSPEARARGLGLLFEETFPGPDAKGKAKAQLPPVGEMEQRLLASVPMDAGQLRALADRRTKAIVRLVLEAGQVEPGRVFEVEGGEQARREGGSRVYFSLK